MSPASVPARRAGVTLERLGEHAVLLDAAGTVARGLNVSAAQVWELIDGRRTAAEIAATLEGDADVRADELLADVLAFLGALADRGLIDDVVQGVQRGS